jgi:3-isopropylmalate/(R)-2-methylmalate dehydratase small subunit
MKAVTEVEGPAIALARDNIDTDIIIPARHLKTLERTGLGKFALEGLFGKGTPLDDPTMADAPIVVAGDNFGCGSSREHAVWALLDRGVTAVIAPGFSDIFSGNAFKNGLVTVVLPRAAVDRLMEVAADHPIRVDLDTMTVTTPLQDRFEFALDPFRRKCLMEGLDEVSLTLKADAAISAHEAKGDAPFLRAVPAL